jgi:uncharacterized protein
VTTRAAKPPGDATRDVAPDARFTSDIVLFFAATFVASWTLWFLASQLTAGDELGLDIRTLLFLPGTFTPAFVALWLSARRDRSRGVRALLGRITRWDVPLRWYAFALAFMVGVKLLAAAIFRLVEGTWPAFGPVPLYLLLGAAVFSTPFQVGEELGWRGFALPRLAARIGLRWAAVLLGVVWALWHLPLFYLHGADMTGQPFPVFLMSVTALSVAMAWLYERSGGSLLVVMLMHAAVNNTTGVVPAGSVVPGNPMTVSATSMAWLTAGVLCVAALVLLATMRRETETSSPTANT